MANQLGSNPWVIDTPGATVLCATDVKVHHFEFVGYAAQGNQCIVQDRFGKNVWVGIGAADLEEVRSGNIGQPGHYGIAVPTLQGGGTLRIYFE